MRATRFVFWLIHPSRVYLSERSLKRPCSPKAFLGIAIVQATTEFLLPILLSPFLLAFRLIYRSPSLDLHPDEVLETT